MLFSHFSGELVTFTVALMNEHKMSFLSKPLPAEGSTWLLFSISEAWSEAVNTTWSCRDSQRWRTNWAAKASTKAEFYFRTWTSQSTQTVWPICLSPAWEACCRTAKETRLIKCRCKPHWLPESRVHWANSQPITRFMLYTEDTSSCLCKCYFYCLFLCTYYSGQYCKCNVQCSCHRQGRKGEEREVK